MNKLALTLPGNYTIDPPFVPRGGTIKLNEILTGTLNLFLIIAVVLAVVFFLWGGIRWITSGGDPKAVEGARKQLTYAIIGLIIAIAGFLIVNVVGGLFQTKLIQ